MFYIVNYCRKKFYSQALKVSLLFLRLDHEQEENQPKPILSSLRCTVPLLDNKILTVTKRSSLEGKTGVNGRCQTGRDGHF
jgi:hypothetical protein